MYCPAHGSLENVSLKMDRAGRFTATGVWHPHPHFWSLRLFLTWIKRRSAEEDLQRHFTRSPLQELQSALLECFIPSQLTDLCSVICPHWGVHWRRLRLRKKWQMGGKKSKKFNRWRWRVEKISEGFMLRKDIWANKTQKTKFEKGRCSRKKMWWRKEVHVWWQICHAELKPMNAKSKMGRRWDETQRMWKCKC